MLVLRARSLARKTGLIRLINKTRDFSNYEEAFNKELAAGIKPGDVVWDIGANVGIYTELFGQWVGENGSVVAFEPGPEAIESIRERVGGCPWVTLENCALGETDATGRFVVESGKSVDNHIQTDADADHQDTIPVVICRSDTVAKRLGRTPNVVKIDVEGFEEEVLGGFGALLKAPELRSLFVEVHFDKLEKRGQPAAPVRIEKLLKSSGFKTKWADPSHMVATR